MYFDHILEFTRQLKQQEKQKNWRKYKEAKRVTIGRKRDTIWKDQNMLSTLWKTCHDGKNVTWFGETLIQLFVIQRKTCHDLLKNVTRFWANFCAYLSWSLFQKQGWRLEKRKVRFWDYMTARRAISSSFYLFMYVLIPILIMLYVNSIMSS